MKHFTNVHDIGPLDSAVKEALELKANRFAHTALGKNRTLIRACEHASAPRRQQ